MFVFVPPLRGLFVFFGTSYPGLTPRALSCRPSGASRLAKRMFFNREWTRSNANVAEHSFSLREKVAAGRMMVNPRMVFCIGQCSIAGLIITGVTRWQFFSQFSAGAVQQHFHRADALIHYICGFSEVSVFGIKMPQGGELTLGDQRLGPAPDAFGLFAGDQLAARGGVGDPVRVLRLEKSFAAKVVMASREAMV